MEKQREREGLGGRVGSIDGLFGRGREGRRRGHGHHQSQIRGDGTRQLCHTQKHIDSGDSKMGPKNGPKSDYRSPKMENDTVTSPYKYSLRDPSEDTDYRASFLAGYAAHQITVGAQSRGCDRSPASAAARMRLRG